MEITRHFTATTFIVHKNMVLLHMHKKFGSWLPVGGHIDPNEIPEVAARREIMEECGLEVEFYNPDKSIGIGVTSHEASQLLRPMHLLLETIKEDHFHIDFIYYATTDNDKVVPGHGESDEIEWFSAEEVKALHNIYDDTRVLALEALKLLKNK